MACARWPLSLGGLLLLQLPAYAASITINGQDPRENVTVTIEEETVDVVLNELRSKYNFEVRGLQHAKKDDPISATLSGSLHSVLERLLRNWNYVIVRSATAESGIEKVVIIDAKFGNLPSKAAGPSTGAASNTDVP